MKHFLFIRQWTSTGINRHTVRKFLFNGMYYYVDKTHNGLGGFYSVTTEKNPYGVFPTMKIFGENCFGAGWRWEKAIKYIESYLNSQ